MGLKWLITGGCGFIGTSLIDSLVNEGGHSIRVLDNLTVGTKEDLASVSNYEMCEAGNLKQINEGACQLIKGDILNDQLALSVTEGMDVIVHLAANTGVGPSVEDPRSDCMTNVLGIFNYLEAARINNVKRFIFASSGAPAGEVDPPIHENLPSKPVSPYGASKLAGEGYCSAYCRTFGIETISLRFGNVYGPRSGHKNSVVAKFIRQAINGDILEIYGDGTQTRDFIYIQDLVDAIRKSVVSEGCGGEAYQIATNQETTLNEMLNILVPILKKSGVSNITLKHAEVRLGDVMRNYSDTSKAKRYLGWSHVTELQDGLEMTVRSFLD